MYMKKYIFLAASALTLASCTSEDFLGNTPGSTPTSANSAIKFDGNAGKITRATSNEGSAEQMLDYQFKIYGVKSGEIGKYSKVFEDYSIWWNTNLTTSNTKSWEYVGEKNASYTIPTTATSINIGKDQTIKFWDYASDNYHFVAGSPIDNFTYKLDNNGNIASAEIKGLGGHINANKGTTANTFNPVYVAVPKTVTTTEYQKPVQFQFVRQQSMVRVGIYETIPGYKIKEIHFYEQKNGNLEVTTDNNIILTSGTANYFVGGNNVTGTITYDWTNSSYSLEYPTEGLTKSQNWYGGKLENGVEATTSTAEVAKLYGNDLDMATNTGYFTVMSTPANTTEAAILMKCDYTLLSEDSSGETIKVTGATAAIPAAYSKWNVNTRYTYLFKISDKTNGYTGDDETKTGLYPITFDAMVKDDVQGTITTFTTPSITTKQDDSVVENGGIKYVTGKDITVKVTKSTDGTDLTLSETADQNGYIDVYKFTDPITEAEAQVKGTGTGTKVAGTTIDTDKKVFTFKPDAVGYYVIRYLTKEENSSAVYTYKVVYVEEAAPATK